ncbi:dihydrolipoyl dehydrogenase family protein [Psychrobacillus sp. NPDC093200]|uniref:dihydrolipoyl dehydrogenase family protein n=1 Tax=Psychrobacillus sp. NPDC093200 TaxID=3390656 RepID=UPI003D051E36
MVVGEISHQRNLIIIGGGPGGYSAAIRGAQLGLSVTLIEQKEIGGVCLNEGCIPSKVYTYVGMRRTEAEQLAMFGVDTIVKEIDLYKLMEYQTKVIGQLKTGVERLCQANKVEIIQGKASFIGKNKIGVENGHQFDIYEFDKIIIATGSKNILPDYVKSKENRILYPFELFQLKKLPEQLIIDGQDYIALEAASSFAALGSKVTLLIETNTGFPFDEDINKELLRLFKKRKIKVIAKKEILTIKENVNGLSINLLTDQQKEVILEGSYFVVPETRKPKLEELGILRLGMKLSLNGFIQINNYMETSISNVYAIGDVTEGPMLAWKAIKQGKAVVSSIVGEKPEVDLTIVPNCAHTVPPVASIGLTEHQALKLGLSIRVSKFPLASNGYSTITGKKDGFIKVISNNTNDLIEGIHMIGEGALEMSGSFLQLLEMSAKEEDIKFPNYTHPGFNEALLESVEGLLGQAIHLSPLKKEATIS